MTFQEHVNRIDALTRNARNTWFGLLGALVFVAIVLMGVEDIDFYGYDRATQLPLIGVSVPTRIFFVGAPLLVAAIYGYFHLYLIRLWDALAAAPAMEGRKRLGETVEPWLITDMALCLKDGASRRKPLDTAAQHLNFFAAWMLGLIILAWLWWEGATARTIEITLIAALSTIAASVMAYASGRMLWLRIKQADQKTLASRDPFLIAAVAVLTPVFFVASHARTGTSFAVFNSATIAMPSWVPQMPLAKVNLTGAEGVEHPGGWLEYQDAYREFRRDWCRRESQPVDCETNGQVRLPFQDEWKRRRLSQIRALNSPDINFWSETSWLDAYIELGSTDTGNAPERNQATLEWTRELSLSGLALMQADMRNGFFPGINLIGARLSDAEIGGANLEGSLMLGVQLQGADLQSSQLQNANLSGAQLQDTDLARADMRGAALAGSNLEFATLQTANLSSAFLNGAYVRDANLSFANLANADLTEATLEVSDLSHADLSGANLSWVLASGAWFVETNLEEAELVNAQLALADLRFANLQNATLTSANLRGAFLIGAQLEGTNLSLTRLDRAHLRHSYIGGTQAHKVRMNGANLSGSSNQGGALQRVDLSDAVIDSAMAWRNAFLDASVDRAELLDNKMGYPCQWVNVVVDAENEFMALWRWWVSTEPRFDSWRLVGTRLQDVEPATLELRRKYGIPDDCTWHTNPLPAHPELSEP